MEKLINILISHNIYQDQNHRSSIPYVKIYLIPKVEH